MRTHKQGLLASGLLLLLGSVSWAHAEGSLTKLWKNAQNAGERAVQRGEEKAVDLAFDPILKPVEQALDLVPPIEKAETTDPAPFFAKLREAHQEAEGQFFGKSRTIAAVFSSDVENYLNDDYFLWGVNHVLVELARTKQGLNLVKGNPSLEQLPPLLRKQRSCIDKVMVLDQGEGMTAKLSKKYPAVTKKMDALRTKAKPKLDPLVYWMTRPVHRPSVMAFIDEFAAKLQTRKRQLVQQIAKDQGKDPRKLAELPGSWCEEHTK